LAKAEDKLNFIPTMTDLDPSDAWRGERGRIDIDLLRRHLQDVSSGVYYLTGPPEPIYYLTGPSGLVRALRTMLVDVGIDEGDIRTEEFTGY
jgi:hypothetical protein